VCDDVHVVTVPKRYESASGNGSADRAGCVTALRTRARVRHCPVLRVPRVRQGTGFGRLIHPNEIDLVGSVSTMFIDSILQSHVECLMIHGHIISQQFFRISGEICE